MADGKTITAFAVRAKNDGAITLGRLKETVIYYPETGIFRSIETRGRAAFGDVLGHHHDDKYVRICIDGVTFMAHRLAWLYVNDAWPDGEIDHINGKTDDNRIENLRVVTRGQNSKNRALQSNNTSGVMGVSWCKIKSRYQARIKVDGRMVKLGYFRDINDAAAAYSAAAEKHFGEFRRNA